MSFTLPELPYALDALEPYISKRTLEFHYGKHHKGYVDKLNKLTAGTEFENLDLEEVILETYQIHPKIYNNAAQAWNHTFLWKCMCKGGQAPSENLQARLTEQFGSIEMLKEEFFKCSKELFGSGWAWLVKTTEGELEIRPLKNARNPINDGDIPLLTCDVWEHAYYLDCQNDRPRYVENFWKVVDWDFVETNLESKVVRPTYEGSKSFSEPPSARH